MDATGREAESKAFIDASCRKCGAHVGWFGRIVDHPPCPKCGAEPDKSRLAVDQVEMDLEREMLAELQTANPGWEKWQKARVAAGLTLRQAAKLLDVSPSELSGHEQCRTVPTEEMARRMADLYSGARPNPPEPDMATIDTLAGRHVHRGVLVARRVCCLDKGECRG